MICTDKLAVLTSIERILCCSAAIFVSFLFLEVEMKDDLRKYLFSKGFLVGEKDAPNSFEVVFTLAKRFAIEITDGHSLACKSLIKDAADCLGEYVYPPFYKGFPQSVRELSKEALVYDQLLHYYYRSLGIERDEAKHSLFEREFERLAYEEDEVKKPFVILTEEQAQKRLEGYFDDMMASTRPLSKEQLQVINVCVTEMGYKITKCNSKENIVSLLLLTKSTKLVDMLSLSDVIKVVDTLNYEQYHNKNIKKLNFKNKDRQFITRILDRILQRPVANVTECYEKKAIWSGLLHHIHYVPKTELGKSFVEKMRGKVNESVYSAFESAIEKEDPKLAADILYNGKGGGAVLRSLNYLVSRCKDEEDIKYIIDKIDSVNPVILLQLLVQYANYNSAPRVFSFVKHGLLKHYDESEATANLRTTVLRDDQVSVVKKSIEEKLALTLKNKAGRVYVSDDMSLVAPPINESGSQLGLNVLTKGTRLKLGEGKKLRAFTYWEKVYDIDLSAVGIRSDGGEEEFSWRDMALRQSDGITYSGDQTNGYNGGSEYFDVDLEKFKWRHPEVKYLVFCNNVYSGTDFSECKCTAGFMLRDKEDSGEVFEPKSVKTSFQINCASTFAYLFAVDIERGEIIWFNTGVEGKNRIAFGNKTAGVINKYLHITDVINVKALFEMMATEIVSNSEEADIVVSDEELPIKDGAVVIRKCDFEKITAMMGNR